MSKDCQVMLDLETLSTKHTAAIVSIGAVKFSLSQGIISSFKVNIDPASCKQYGLHLDKNTISWWGTQSKEARQGWMKDPQSLSVGVKYFIDWYGNKPLKTWSKGSTFDFPILENAMQVCEYNTPWKYWHIYDYRTVINILGIDDKAMKSSESVSHDAVSDCEEQVKVLIPILKSFEDI